MPIGECVDCILWMPLISAQLLRFLRYFEGGNIHEGNFRKILLEPLSKEQDRHRCTPQQIHVQTSHLKQQPVQTVTSQKAEENNAARQSQIDAKIM